MAISFSLEAILGLPGGPNLGADDISVKLASVFDHQAEFRLALTGTGTKTVDLGTIDSPGVKALLVYVETGTGAPITIQFDGSSSGGIELSPGGFVAMANPVPVAGVLQLDVTYTTANKVRIWALA